MSRETGSILHAWLCLFVRAGGAQVACGTAPAVISTQQHCAPGVTRHKPPDVPCICSGKAKSTRCCRHIVWASTAAGSWTVAPSEAQIWEHSPHPHVAAQLEQGCSSFFSFKIRGFALSEAKWGLGDAKIHAHVAAHNLGTCAVCHSR